MKTTKFKASFKASFVRVESKIIIVQRICMQEKKCWRLETFSNFAIPYPVVVSITAVDDLRRLQL